MTLLTDKGSPPSPEETCQFLANLVVNKSRQEHCPTFTTSSIGVGVGLQRYIALYSTIDFLNITCQNGALLICSFQAPLVTESILLVTKSD